MDTNTTENQKNKETPAAQREKKERTPQQIQRRKKMVVFPLMFLLFAGVMWLIFAPSGKEKEATKEGFNTDFPTPKESGIIGGKIEAYTQEAMQTKQQEKLRSLQDFAFALGENEETEEQLLVSSQPASRSNNAFQSSTYAYEDVNRQLGSFYEEPATDPDEQAQLALEWRIQELERRLEDAQTAESAEQKQLELIEKSYAIAAKYMPNNQTGATPDVQIQTTESPINMNAKVVAKPVSGVRQSVVSLLASPLENEAFLEEYAKPRNMGFITAAGSEAETDKNSIRASVYQTITLSNGKELQLRLSEPMRAGNLLIPAGTLLTGSAKIGGERLHITISSIQYADNIIPVALEVYDMDGMQGIFVPNTEEVTAIKEIAANMGTSMGSSITITDDAGSQLAADLGRGAIQGVSQYFSRKMREVKVTLNAGYKVLLLAKT